MARSHAEQKVSPRPVANKVAHHPAAEQSQDQSTGKMPPGWTIAATCWVVLFGVLTIYEAWGFFGGMLRR